MSSARASAFTVDLLDRTSAISKLPGELDELAARALEPNVFYEPLMLMPALRFIDVHVPVLVACVRGPSGRLMGAVPLVIEPMRGGFPVMVLRNWLHRYCFLGTPLLDAGAARNVLEALAAWIASGAAPARGLQWVKVGWDGPFGRLVEQTFGQSPAWTMDVSTAQRAMLERVRDLKPPISAKHAKELRRLERRLAARGAIDYAVLQKEDDWQPWYDAFLALEASGWKGAEGSAVGSKAEDAAFFRSVVQHAHASERLQLLRLTHAGKAVAMKLNVRARGESYSLKIGHDEDFAQYSPGVLLELFNIKAFAREPAVIARMDSCATENHPMINRLWPGRREMATVTLARHGMLLRALVKLRPLARQLRKTKLSIGVSL